MSQSPPVAERYQWAKKGDINAFFGLLLDNLSGLILLVALMGLRFGFPTDFALTAMVPGTALGVLIGDLIFFFVAIRLAKRTGRNDITAMPLGLDTPSTFGMVFFVLGPSFLDGKAMGLETLDAAQQTWHIGIWCVLLSGILKLVLAPFSEKIRQLIPRAGLLGSLAAIALVLISFIPLLDVLKHPLPGMLALVIVLTTLVGQIELPFRTPGTLGALIVAGIVYYVLCGIGGPGYHWPTTPEVQWFPQKWLEAWQFNWLDDFSAALSYLPIVLPFALATIVGGIDCTESAVAAGDPYDTRTVVGVEAVATILAALSGGVIQTTPYIGHPAYKAMGGRAAYTLATALVVGASGLVGFFSLINTWLPPATVYPILMFIGIEITAQSFLATPRRHYPAVAMACLPALAFLALMIPGQIFGDDAMSAAGITQDKLANEGLRASLQTLAMISSGFILVSLLWAWMLASVIDRRLNIAGWVMFASGCLTLVGVIHSPLPGNRLFIPFGPESLGDLVLAPAYRWQVFEFAGAYMLTAAVLAIWSRYLATQEPPADDRDVDVHSSHDLAG
jgi:adenine/guanine/hypoxanthine permease